MLFLVCILSSTSYANEQSTGELQSQVKDLKVQNDLLQRKIAQLDSVQSWNIHQYHDDVSSSVSTFMTWVGIIAGLIAIIVTAISIAIPIVTNRRFERRLDDKIKDFIETQERLTTSNKDEQSSWMENLEQEQKIKFDGLLNKMEEIKGDVVKIQERAKESEKNAMISQILSEANREIGEKHFENAIRLCSQLIQKYPNNHDAYNIRGIAYAIQMMFKEAIQNFNEAIRIHPTKHNLSNKALAEVNIKNYAQAIEDYTEAIKLDKNDSKIYAARAFVYAQQNDYEKAKSDYDEAIKINPEEPSYYENRGIMKLSLMKYNDAIDDFSIAIKKKDDEPEFYFNRGNARLENGDNIGAIQDYDEAIKLDGKNYRFFHNRGMAKRRIGNLKESLYDFNESLKINNSIPNLFSSRGALLMDMKKYKEAIEDFSAALLLDENDYTNYYNRGNAKSSLGDYKAAINDYDEAIRLNYKDPSVYYTRGLAKLNLKEYQDAIMDFDEAIKIDKKEPISFYYRSVAKFMLNNLEGALLDCKKAIELDNENPKLYIHKGNIEYKLQKYQIAISDIEMGIAYHASKAEGYNLIALCYLELNMYSKALKYINEAILLTKGKDGFIMDTRGQIHLAMGHHDLALADFNEAIKLNNNVEELFRNRALCYRKMAEIEGDENVKLEFINNAEADETEVERLRKESN